MSVMLEARPASVNYAPNSNPMLAARASHWSRKWPLIISGGQAVGVACWESARAESLYGLTADQESLGTIGGTGLAIVTARRMQDGDPGGHLRRAFYSFPYQEMAERVWNRWFIEHDRNEGQPYRPIPMVNLRPGRDIAELTICANYVAVWLAKEGHNRKIGINYLTKVETPHLLEIFGAMLAGIDIVVMGAGIPRQIPQILNKFANYQEAFYALDVRGGKPGEFMMDLNPSRYVPIDKIRKMERPWFFPIVSRHELARFMDDEKKTPGGVDGYIVAYSGINAGHSAPARDGKIDKKTGEPIYNPERDYADLEEMKRLGKPFWPAGGQAAPNKIREALAQGAAGVQVGSITAASEESKFTDSIKGWLRWMGYNNLLQVITDPRISPTDYPFNRALIPETMDFELYLLRQRICDLGYLRRSYKKENGTLGFRCPADVMEIFINAGGKEEDAIGRGCLCNALCAAIGLGQVRPWGRELAIATFGHDTKIIYNFLHGVMRHEEDTYSVDNAFDYLLGNEVVKAAV